MSFLSRLIARAKGDANARLQRRISSAVDSALQSSGASEPDAFTLPPGFARGLPERAVEVLLARLSYRAGQRVLDVGHANAMACHLEMISGLPEPRRITGVDIAEPSYDVTPYYERSLAGDATAMPVAAGAYDLVWCISSLEHFGADNSGYVGGCARVADADVRALKEIVRVLSAGGRALVSVPYGKHEDHGWFRQYDADRWQRLLEDTMRPGCQVSELYFGHSRSTGWRRVDSGDLAGTGYYDERNSGAAGLAVAYITKIAPVP